jgi:hypothetical protein
VAIDNAQNGTENTARHAVLKLVYYHPIAGRTTIDPGFWLPAENTVPMSQSTSTDISNEGRFNAVYVMTSEVSGACFPLVTDEAIAPGEKLAIGKWRVVVSVTADNCHSLRFGIAFRVAGDGRLTDQSLVTSDQRFADWLTGEGTGSKDTRATKTYLSSKAERLLLDLADECTVFRHTSGAPAIVMPKPGNPIPQTRGQVENEVVQELEDKNIVKFPI